MGWKSCSNQISTAHKEGAAPAMHKKFIPEHDPPLQMANSKETQRKATGDVRQCSPSTQAHLPQQAGSESPGSGNYRIIAVQSPSSHFHGEYFTHEPSKADSTTSSRIPRPKSLTKFAAFESAFCKFCSSMLSAERVFKGKAGCLTNSSTSDLTKLRLLLLQPQIQTKPPLLLPCSEKMGLDGSIAGYSSSQ